jgi:hypothetical protein
LIFKLNNFWVKRRQRRVFFQRNAGPGISQSALDGCFLHHTAGQVLFTSSIACRLVELFEIVRFGLNNKKHHFALVSTKEVHSIVKNSAQ